MERIEAFEAMLKAALDQSEAEQRKMEELKAQGREKSATYRQYLGNRLFYNQLFALYRQYGLISQRGEREQYGCCLQQARQCSQR